MFLTKSKIYESRVIEERIPKKDLHSIDVAPRYYKYIDYLAAIGNFNVYTLMIFSIERGYINILQFLITRGYCSFHDAMRETRDKKLYTYLMRENMKEIRNRPPIQRMSFEQEDNLLKKCHPRNCFNKNCCLSECPPTRLEKCLCCFSMFPSPTKMCCRRTSYDKWVFFDTKKCSEDCTEGCAYCCASCCCGCLDIVCFCYPVSDMEDSFVSFPG